MTRRHDLRHRLRRASVRTEAAAPARAPVGRGTSRAGGPLSTGRRADGARATGLPIGKVLVSAVAVSAGASAFTADWNDTHIYNPRWPSHAKFHNAQTMLSAVQLGALSLWQLWGRQPADRSALNWGALLAALYWLSQAPAILFPGTALTDPEHAATQRAVGPVPVNQLSGIAVVLAPLLAAGYLLESRSLRRVGR